MELFQQRARAARPDFEVDATNAADVAAIVVALDGLPLAIELAAAHIDVLPPAGIRQRLADRFDLLQSDQWDAPVRQHTLRAAIDSSAALLTVEERNHLATTRGVCRLVRPGGGGSSHQVRSGSARIG